MFSKYFFKQKVNIKGERHFNLEYEIKSFELGIQSILNPAPPYQPITAKSSSLSKDSDPKLLTTIY